jgi:LysM repeat protein
MSPRILLLLSAFGLSLALVGAAANAEPPSLPVPVASTLGQPTAAQPPITSPSSAPSLATRPMGTYLLRPGDTLFGVARLYGIAAPDLARMAAAVGGAPSAGVTPTAQPSYTVQPGDTLYALAARFAVSAGDLSRWNGLSDEGLLHVGDELQLSEDSTAGEAEVDNAGPPVGEPTEVAPVTLPESTRDESVTVQPGDTLSSIAANFGTTANTLLRLNGLEGDFLSAGQTLKVPRAGQGPRGLVGAKRIEVDVSEQRMYVWQGDTLVWNFTTSTGLDGYATRRGTFAVQSKVPKAWSTAWQLWMPNWLGIYWAGGSENGIHALPIINGQRLWGGYLGSPISYGCVVLGIDDAEALYNWADMGTPVVIHD